MYSETQHSELGVEIQNTRSMRMDPQPVEAFNSLEDLGAGSEHVSVITTFSGEAFQKFVNYPIIVEMWEKRKAGRVRRAWEAAFTQAERNKISRYYGRFYRWHLVSGTPLKVACNLGTLDLLQRAVEFFASV